MKLKLLSENARVPVKSKQGDVGFDLFSPKDETINPGCHKLIPTDIAITELPSNTYCRIAPRSGLALKGVDVMGGVVDANYQGNIGVILSVFSDGEVLEIKKGDRIAQIIFEKCIPNVDFELVDSFNAPTDRGAAGFGSTGF